ncbi:MAG: N-6 DNA methylase [Candidatus Marinimicrobia bacterium]|nr:N-6 DNA methylase [Candidatus Neomarinimicrobiota bacterium]
MKYPSIRIEGAILSADILDKIEQGELLGQKPKDFGFEGSNVRVKDEIVKAWADAQDMWRIYKRKIEDVPESKAGTTETRNFWMVPLLGLLGYDVELYRKAQEISGKTYAISHKAINLDTFPIHVMGFRDSLDKKRQDSGPRMSPHALIQEYINLHEHLYALVSNGLSIRLLRDSSRLIKLSFLEFDLERMFEEEHFADFALMFRLIHCSRMPVKQTEGPESLIEGYHQDSLDSGSRIRDGLNNAVEKSIKSVANGFLSHPENDSLRQAIIEGNLSEKTFYQYQLRFIYRLLFLMVIEERDLIFTNDTPRKKKDIYYHYYSVNRIRKLSEKRYLADKKFSDVWMSLKNTFKLFEKEFYGEKLDIKPLAGDLFGSHALGELNHCELNNKVMLECLINLSVFTNPNTQQKMRVNYASLNVEEFGSVYEGLLEYDPVLDVNGSKVEFSLVKGSERSSSGSHYTPDELVQPLIKHSLEYIIEDKLKESDPENALLSITVCDVACGSGHFLLGAARRIATELAKIRTGEDQPSPSAFREAVRDVIRNSIYGVDLNPLAVELAKVALWLEAHNPGEPLNFLDHKIKCGDAIVGLAHLNELENGIANEAFKKLPGDDETARTLVKRNKSEKNTQQTGLDFDKQVGQKIKDVNSAYAHFNKMPETTPAEIEIKHKVYNHLSSGTDWWKLKTLADIQTAQFFIPKTIEHSDHLITESTYRDMLAGTKTLQGSRAVAQANAVASEKRFFHWFLEFPEVFANDGFDCILGNPPFLGGQKISGNYGNNYLEWLKSAFAPIGAVDLVTYFYRRIFTIIQEGGFQSLLATNTIAQGDAREDGLVIIQNQGGSINYAFRSMQWPGLATVEVSQVAIHKGVWKKDFILDNKKVKCITSFLDDSEDLGEPFDLNQNNDKSFYGSVVLGKGFVLNADETEKLIEYDNNNKSVVFPYLIGHDLNNSPNQKPSRYIINFFDWGKDYCQKKYPACFKIVEEKVKPHRRRDGNTMGRETWWLYYRAVLKLYRTIKPFELVICISKATKYIQPILVKRDCVFDQAIIVLAFDDFYSISILNSFAHTLWSEKYRSTLGGTSYYVPTKAFQPFPFPQNLSQKTENELEQIGETYHEFRRQLMLKMQLGLTKTYNQFHNPQLSSEIANAQIVSRKELEKKYGKETVYLWNHLNKTDDVCSLEEAVHDIKHLRQLHKEMDEAVLKAYCWHEDTDKWGPAINLTHDFYEVDYLPENDRVRYTISPEARKEVLKRLLLLNHEIYAEEVKQGLHGKQKGQEKTKKVSGPKVPYNPKQSALFTEPKPNIRDHVGDDFHVGQNISHPTFGKGVIKAIEGIGDNEKLTIAFSGGVEKKLAVKLANLTGIV